MSYQVLVAVAEGEAWSFDAAVLDDLGRELGGGSFDELETSRGLLRTVHVELDGRPLTATRTPDGAFISLGGVAEDVVTVVLLLRRMTPVKVPLVVFDSAYSFDLVELTDTTDAAALLTAIRSG